MTPAKLTAVARTLRKRDTWAEKLMWSWIRHRRFSAYKFRRQHPYPRFVLDFFCVEARVNIELDGGHHWSSTQSQQDVQRDAWLASRGIKVLRFANRRLRSEKESVRDA